MHFSSVLSYRFSFLFFLLFYLFSFVPSTFLASPLLFVDVIHITISFSHAVAAAATAKSVLNRARPSNLMPSDADYKAGNVYSNGNFATIGSDHNVTSIMISTSKYLDVILLVFITYIAVPENLKYCPA